MRKFQFFWVSLYLVCFLVGCQSNKKANTILLNEPLSVDKKSIIDTISLMVNSASIKPVYSIIDKGIKYNIGVNDNKVTYISTSDTAFILSDKFKIGTTTYHDMPQSLKEIGYYRSGFAFIIKVGEKWNIAFFDSSVMKQHYPADTSKISFFFQE